jgi:hypothetical protein
VVDRTIHGALGKAPFAEKLCQFEIQRPDAFRSYDLQIVSVNFAWAWAHPLIGEAGGVHAVGHELCTGTNDVAACKVLSRDAL